MKKKFFGAVVVVAIAVGAMINVNLNKTSNKGGLALANVEALAQAEEQPGDSWWSNWGSYVEVRYQGRTYTEVVAVIVNGVITGYTYVTKTTESYTVMECRGWAGHC